MQRLKDKAKESGIEIPINAFHTFVGIDRKLKEIYEKTSPILENTNGTAKPGVPFIC